jgi:dTDP-4-dehydrorhamnose 3,5-epimerase
MRVQPAPLPGVLVIQPMVSRDRRGYFVETYHEERYHDRGITDRFVQDNHSHSFAGTLRGLHLQVRRPQAKLVRVVAGAIYDVAVDVRRGSPAFGRWFGLTLSEDNYRQCYIPRGFAHGFCVLSERAHVEYKCSDFYDPGGEIGIRWDDPALAIDWPVRTPVLSDRDRQHPLLAELTDQLPEFSE